MNFKFEVPKYIQEGVIMQESLSKLINGLKSKKFPSATLVLGNISCDLDSAVSSIVYALFLHWQHESLRGRVCTRQYRTSEDCQQIHVPILNVRREDYELKTEVAHCLGTNGLTKDELLFRDDLDFERLVQSTNTKIVLVDHHILSDEDKFIQNYVIEILDHRPKDTKNWTYGEDVRTNIQLVGSCSTLVCERIRLNEENRQFFEIYEPCTRLLYDAIILDTVNFSKEVKKGTPLDLEQVTYLESILKVQDPLCHRDQVLLQLVNARKDITHLTAAQLIRKDVKICGPTLVPSFPVLVEEVLSREDISTALVEELRRRQCTAAVLLGMCLSDGLRRDLAIFSQDPSLIEKLSSVLKEWSDPPLQLEEQNVQLANCKYYTQHNVAASRKQVMPALDL